MTMYFNFYNTLQQLGNVVVPMPTNEVATLTQTFNTFIV